VHRAISNILIASTNIQFEQKQIGCGITRQVKDLTSICLMFVAARLAKVATPWQASKL
jgi:hypothetical protein